MNNFPFPRLNCQIFQEEPGDKSKEEADKNEDKRSQKINKGDCLAGNLVWFEEKVVW